MQNLRFVVTIVLIAIVVVFVLQNFTQVTLSLFSINVSMPLALLIVLVYLLGMLTGHTFVSMIRRMTRRF